MPIMPLFSPNGQIAAHIAAGIAAARSSILMNVYEFDSLPIEHALCMAHEYGRRVAIIADKSLKEHANAALSRLALAGIEITVDSSHLIAHQKLTIIDQSTIFVGSYNYSNAAEYRNSENCLIITDDVIAATFTNNWNEHRAHSKPW